MGPDSSPYERQVIDALKTILRSLGGSRTGATSSTSSSTSSSSRATGIASALNTVSTRLDGINSDLRLIIVGETTPVVVEEESETDTL